MSLGDFPRNTYCVASALCRVALQRPQMPKKDLSGMGAAFKQLITALLDKAPDLKTSIQQLTDTPDNVTAKSYIQAAQSALSCFALTSQFKFVDDENVDVTEDIQKHIKTVRFLLCILSYRPSRRLLSVSLCSSLQNALTSCMPILLGCSSSMASRQMNFLPKCKSAFRCGERSNRAA